MNDQNRQMNDQNRQMNDQIRQMNDRNRLMKEQIHHMKFQIRQLFISGFLKVETCPCWAFKRPGHPNGGLGMGFIK